MIDDEHFDWGALRLKLKAKLLLQGREQRRTVWIDGCSGGAPGGGGPGGRPSGVHFKSKSKFPESPVRSTTMRWVNCDNGSVS